MLGRLFSAVEEVSGLAGFLTGLVVIFVGSEMFSVGRNVFGVESVRSVCRGRLGIGTDHHKRSRWEMEGLFSPGIIGFRNRGWHVVRCPPAQSPSIGPLK